MKSVTRQRSWVSDVVTAGDAVVGVVDFVHVGSCGRNLVKLKLKSWWATGQ